MAACTWLSSELAIPLHLQNIYLLKKCKTWWVYICIFYNTYVVCRRLYYIKLFKLVLKPEKIFLVVWWGEGGFGFLVFVELKYLSTCYFMTILLIKINWGRHYWLHSPLPLWLRQYRYRFKHIIISKVNMMFMRACDSFTTIGKIKYLIIIIFYYNHSWFSLGVNLGCSNDYGFI